MEEINEFLYPHYQRIKHKVHYTHKAFNSEQKTKKITVRVFIKDSFVRSFTSIREAAKYYNISNVKIIRNLNTNPIEINGVSLFFRG